MLKTREKIIKRLLKGKNVLDLGNSWGDFKDLIKKYSKNYKGLDIEPITDYKKDLNKPFNLNQKFDLIIAGELIEHIENTNIFLDNIKKHLKVGGLLFITTPNPTSFRFIIYGLFNKEPEFGGHVNYFTKDSLKLLLKKYFEIRKIGFCNVTTNIKKKGFIWKIKFFIENLIGNIIPRYSPHLYVICQKK